jgi:hypothetical protein
MRTTETFVAGAKSQDILLTTYATEPMPESNGILPSQRFGEGPELAILRMLGLFDRPADEKALGALLKSPAIVGLTESLTNFEPDHVAHDLG